MVSHEIPIFFGDCSIQTIQLLGYPFKRLKGTMFPTAVAGPRPQRRERGLDLFPAWAPRAGDLGKGGGGEVKKKPGATPRGGVGLVGFSGKNPMVMKMVITCCNQCYNHGCNYMDRTIWI